MGLTLGRGEAKLKKYPEIVFEEGKFDGNDSTNTYVQAGYTVTATSSLGDSGTGPGYQPWGAFNGTTGIYEDAWVSQTVYSATAPGAATASAVEFPVSSGRRGEYIDLQMPNAIKVASFVIKTRSPTGHFIPEDSPGAGYLYGSNNGTAWTEIKAFSGLTYGGMGTDGGTQEKVEVNSTVAYKYLRLQGTHRSGVSGTDQYLSIGQIEYYGYEEDPPAGDTSVDTTFTSIMNTPQTTGAKFTRTPNCHPTSRTASRDPTPPDPPRPMMRLESTGNSMELSTSNIAVEANTFLEGDAPHSVSVWFNSSNLEANVSNTCVFSISDQEKLDSVNLDLQSNTWHNLTYAYQGEGGSRVTYLDGRKVAEDQAEDTFGDYPPFAMTGYSQGGYVVSSSGFNAPNYPPWEAFDDDITDLNNVWHTPGADYSGTDQVYNGSDNFQLSSNTDFGHWIKIEMPHKLIVSHLGLRARIDGYESQAPEDFQICGSNDDVNWDILADINGASPQDDGSSYYVVNSNKGYRYHAIVCSKSVNATVVVIQNLKFYGHRENDLVRLPDPTNVLKYPHIAMTGPAQRGYVASASSTAQAPYLGFTPATSASAWVSGNTTDYDGANNDYNATTYRLGALVGGGNTEYGEWLKLELPHKLAVNKMILTADPGGTYGINEAPDAWKIYGSNDDTNWVELLSVTGATPTTSGDTRTISNSTAYKYLAIVITSVHNITAKTRVGGLEYYGTGVDSVPIQIGGGNIDKVANFRVYDKFVGEDQALEIWDAQKDAFGRAKSSMTLHKGRLGIGTTEPEGRLAVADEPHGLEEFPPRAMTGYETYMEGHGMFKASAHFDDPSELPIYLAFDKDTTTVGIPREIVFDVTSPFAANTLAPSTLTDSGSILGTWAQLELPYKAKVDQVLIAPRYGFQVHASFAGGYIVGSNDKETWSVLKRVTSVIQPPNGEYVTINTTSSTGFYKYFRVICTNLAGLKSNDMKWQVAEIKFFGTREQGQSVLHDGQLTLTKSLTVPRIGPALDADDTPRRDRLVVEYNTSTNPTFEGAVRDTSGRGNDGVFYGTNMNYSSTEKALVFNGTDDYARSIRLNNTGGDYIHSVSWWFKTDITTSAIGTNEEVMWHLGDAWAARICSYASFYGNRIYLAWNTYNINCATTNINQLQWNHACVTYTGGGSSLTSRKFYLNGELEPAILDNVEGTLLNLPANTLLTLGARKPTATNTIASTYFDGQISNFKLYDTALTAEEAKTLYDMGRCDEGHHMVNFSKTRVGIGLGDGEAPRGALDVREQGIFRDILFDQRSTDNNNGVSVVRYRRGGEGGNYWKNWVNASNHYYFNYNGADSGYFASSGPNTRVQNFTGQHRTFIKDVPFSEASNLEGLIVSSDQNKYIKMSGGIEAGSNAITTNESLPVVSLSTTTNDKKCFGVISTSEDPETREDTHGILTSIFEKEKGDTRVYINSVGEGAIWVSNIGGSLEAGDYITTSNVAGYGQKQNDDVLHNYTVAKITMDCDFEPATQPVQQILRSNVVETYYLGNVHHTKTVPHEFVTTTVTANDDWSNVSISPSDTTYAEWSNLEANTQNTYTLTYTQTSNVVYDTKYTLTTTANVTESDAWDKVFVDPPTVTYAEWSNLEANTQNTYTLTYTQTTTDEKTPDEWSTLESNVQSLYNKVYYQSVEEEVAKDYPGAVAHTRVTDVIENELDEHGQIQWEDHPTDTEKAYKIRYLDASGVETDSANAVHIAAFVGCTYHCG
jgi:hypothetical protein